MDLKEPRPRGRHGVDEQGPVEVQVPGLAAPLKALGQLSRGKRGGWVWGEGLRVHDTFLTDPAKQGKRFYRLGHHRWAGTVGRDWLG